MLANRPRDEAQAVAREQLSQRPPMITLVQDALTETIEVLQAHVELAVLEVREDAKVGVRVAIVCGVGGALAFLALAFGLAGATFGLAQVMPAWVACLAVAAITGSCAGVVLVRGRRQLRAHAFAEQSAIALREGEP
jgi:uncharacterized membrane protein YqjE